MYVRKEVHLLKKISKSCFFCPAYCTFKRKNVFRVNDPLIKTSLLLLLILSSLWVHEFCMCFVKLVTLTCTLLHRTLCTAETRVILLICKHHLLSESEITFSFSPSAVFLSIGHSCQTIFYTNYFCLADDKNRYSPLKHTQNTFIDYITTTS